MTKKADAAAKPVSLFSCLKTERQRLLIARPVVIGVKRRDTRDIAHFRNIRTQGLEALVPVDHHVAAAAVHDDGAAGRKLFDFLDRRVVSDIGMFTAPSKWFRSQKPRPATFTITRSGVFSI